MALKLVIKWLTKNARKAETIQLRVEVPEEATIYTCWLRVSLGRIFAPHVYATPRFLGK